jgi:molybdopterin molybdotransferase
MDSYAVSGPGPHRVVGSVLAGTVSPGCLCAGEAVEIATGACVPPSADAVVALEEVDRYGTMLASPQPRSGQHIPGVSLVPAGTAIGPALLGLAASCGHDTLLVRPGPWVRIVLTGDELRHVGPSGDGQVRHALDPMLPALITGLGGEVEQIRWVNDQPAAALTDAIDDPTGDPSVVVVTGSTSVGMTDRLHALLRERGARWVVDGVACRPGHPQLLAELDHNVWVVGLPGNPFAALVAAHTLLAAVIAALCGRPL